MKTSRRISNWPKTLNEFIAAKKNVPFAWGSNDCCLFACDNIRALTGIDPAEKFRGQYDSALGAARLLEPLGGVEGVAATQCAADNFMEIPLLLSRRGDVVLTDRPEVGPTLGVCIDHRAAFPGEMGVIYLPIAGARRAWRID